MSSMSNQIHPLKLEDANSINAENPVPLTDEPMRKSKSKKPNSVSKTALPAIQKSRYKKKCIPSSLKTAIWITYNGECFKSKCHVSWCHNTITVFNFEAGHDIPESKGGATCLDNLKPICSACNKSMGNMYTISEYSRVFAPRARKQRRWLSRMLCWSTSNQC